MNGTVYNCHTEHKLYLQVPVIWGMYTTYHKVLPTVQYIYIYMLEYFSNTNWFLRYSIWEMCTAVHSHCSLSHFYIYISTGTIFHNFDNSYVGKWDKLSMAEQQLYFNSGLIGDTKLLDSSKNYFISLTRFLLKHPPLKPHSHHLQSRS